MLKQTDKHSTNTSEANTVQSHAEANTDTVQSHDETNTEQHNIKSHAEANLEKHSTITC